MGTVTAEVDESGELEEGQVHPLLAVPALRVVTPGGPQNQDSDHWSESEAADALSMPPPLHRAPRTPRLTPTITIVDRK